MQLPFDLVERLRRVQHFSSLSLDDIRTIVSAGFARRYQAGATIFFEDEPCAGMYVLLTGQVYLCRTGPQGQQNILAVIDPVIMFNEVAVLDGGPNPVTAIATQTCLLWQVSHSAFQSLLQRYPPIGLGLLRVLALRNRLMITHYEDLSFRTVLARTAKLLLDLSEGGKRPIQRREHSINEMAARVATVPEAISRSLNTFKNNGQITSTRTTITVRDPTALAALAQVAPPI